MEYIVAKTNEIDPAINSPEWEKAETGYIEYEPWIDRPVKPLTKSPKTSFKVLRGPEGISVLMHTDETHLRAEELEENGNICADSCMEFFLKPSPWDVRYMNFEINPKGVMHLGVGKDRFEREFVQEERKTFSIVSDAKEGDWTLKLYIPFKVIENVYSDLDDLADQGDGVGHGDAISQGVSSVQDSGLILDLAVDRNASEDSEAFVGVVDRLNVGNGFRHKTGAILVVGISGRLI